VFKDIKSAGLPDPAGVLFQTVGTQLKKINFWSNRSYGKALSGGVQILQSNQSTETLKRLTLFS